MPNDAAFCRCRDYLRLYLNLDKVTMPNDAAFCRCRDYPRLYLNLDKVTMPNDAAFCRCRDYLRLYLNLDKVTMPNDAAFCRCRDYPRLYLNLDKVTMPNDAAFCRCRDYLRLYLNLDNPEINEHHQHDYELCGNITDMPQKTYYSKDRALIIEFHSDTSYGNYTGFLGRYKFIDKSKFSCMSGEITTIYVQEVYNV